MKALITMECARISVVLLTLIAAAGSAGAQQLTATRRITDLNPGSGGSDPKNTRVSGQRLYLSASTPGTGREVWYYNGTDFALLADINTGVNDSSPSWLTPFGGSLCFSAFDQKRGGELWRYDGTDTVRVTDINPDADDTIKTTPANSWPTEITEFNNALYFNANSSNTKPNYELWKYDGTLVTQVANIHPDSGSDFSSYPKGLTVFNGAMYFMADDGANGYELWKATPAGATLFANLNSGTASSSSYPKFFTLFNGELYFQAFNTTNGYELWKTDGTSAPVRIDLVPGSNSSFPEFFGVFNGALYFRANIGSTGYELWKYDGTTATLASNIHPTGDSFPKNLTVYKNQLYFAANDGVNGWELWKFNGATSSLVANLNPSGDSFPENLVVQNDNLYFVATTPATGYELWKYDGTTVTLTADPNPGPGDSFPRVPTPFNHELFFSAADDGVGNWEPWGDISVPFQVTTIERTGNDIRLVWSTLGGTTNIVKASDNGVIGPYYNLSAPIIVPGVSATTADYVDVGGVVPGSSRFYRIMKP